MQQRDATLIPQMKTSFVPVTTPRPRDTEEENQSRKSAKHRKTAFFCGPRHVKSDQFLLRIKIYSVSA